MCDHSSQPPRAARRRHTISPVEEPRNARIVMLSAFNLHATASTNAVRLVVQVQLIRTSVIMPVAMIGRSMIPRSYAVVVAHVSGALGGRPRLLRNLS